jgi:hypothetical protein
LKTPRTMKQITADVISTREALWAFERELKDAKAYRKKVCPHNQLYERDKSDSYYEEGRMSSPAYYEWKEKVCKRCGKVLATKHKKTTEQWEGWQKA